MRRCIFCPNLANSREDAWPVWLQESMHPAPGHAVHGQMFMWRGNEDTTPLTWGGPNAAIKIKHVCKSCNEGWMSTLESLVKPIMSPLVNDFELSIGEADQLLLTRWSIKTTMVFESATKKAGWFYCDDDRQRLLTTGKPPLETLVWVGRCGHHASGYVESRRLSGAFATSPNATSPLDTGCVTTFAFGHFVLHSVAFRRKPDAAHVRTTLDIKRGPWHRLLRQIWPIQSRSVNWPTPLSFSDGRYSLDDLGKRYSTGRP